MHDGRIEQLTRHRPVSPYWLIFGGEGGRSEALTVEIPEEVEGLVLPVFSSEEEAKLFVQEASFAAEGWEVRRTGAGELVSLLIGPHRSVRWVALDPAPADMDLRLVSLRRESFVDLLLGRGRSWFERGQRMRRSPQTSRGAEDVPA